MAGGVFFDLDGTFADTAPDMLSALNRMRAEAGHAPLTVGEVRPHISAGARNLLEMFLPGSGEDKGRRRARYLEHYEGTRYRETRLFDGISGLVGALDGAGVAWGIATNKPERYAAPILSGLGMDGRHACLLCPEHIARPKPFPDMLLAAAAIAGREPGECFYIGDDRRDMEAAVAAGMGFIAAGWGYWTVPPDGRTRVAATPAEAGAHILSTAGPG